MSLLCQVVEVVISFGPGEVPSANPPKDWLAGTLECSRQLLRIAARRVSGSAGVVPIRAGAGAIAISVASETRLMASAQAGRPPRLSLLSVASHATAARKRTTRTPRARRSYQDVLPVRRRASCPQQIDEALGGLQPARSHHGR